MKRAQALQGLSREQHEAMATHVRFEERTVFALAQSVLEPSELTDVMKQSASHPSSST